MANREIDFMAWNGRELYYPDSLLNNPLEVGYLDDSGCPKAQYGHPLIQYTGLKDKNGKKIYEGHIIRCVFEKAPSKDKEMVTGNVVWRDCGAMFVVEYHNYSFNFRTGALQTNTYEIIGNIYENPDLLEAKDE